MKKIVFASSVFLASLLTMGKQVFAATTDTEIKRADVTLTEDSTPGASLLEITSASHLNFGSKVIGVDDLNYTDDNSPSIVMTDIRGDAKGWNVSVSLGEFKEATKNQTLKGVRLFYPAVEMTTNSTVNVTKRTPETTATDKSFSDSSVKGLLLDATSTPNSKTLLNADASKGNGRWTATYDSEHKVELNVPAGNLAGSYEANLTYTLLDAPVS